ncbi:hypothetical protein [Bifidobacterium tissieri]|uniref:Glycosyltransferase RgtA/B/C/D-like domain-containing protein n=1 Tax=Bifidobacterium tissieri TaxID=1630162 RepID=A0A5M9ZNS9_9BIFI|nr:hypothetical protein [Bifidobacterium tissieri]KAA8829306.1 hypothetical protein EMO89_08420 [Bifidobacterium tissieri]KAA8831910.1 hypothetical protein EM849_06635 [Bifidobacterium tissieri]
MDAETGHDTKRITWSVSHVVFALANLAVLIAVMLYVDGTSPVHGDHLNLWDTSIFRLAGWVWADGGVPYVDYWDHKGPLIFFINLIGAVVGGPDHGVFYIDVVLMGITMLFLWKILAVIGDQLSVAVRTLIMWITVMWTAYLLVPNMNVTETVCMPFLAAALWLVLRDMRRMHDDQNATVALITAYAQGLACAASLLTRATNALPVFVCVLVLVVMLCVRQQWMSLLGCAVACIGGFLTLVVPFSVYFALRGAFGEFVYGTLTFNLSYAVGTAADVMPGMTVVARILAVPAAAIIVAVIHMLRNRSVDAERMMLLISGIALAILFVRTEMFLHYAVVAAQLIPVILAMAAGWFRSRTIQLTSLIVIVAMLFGVTIYQERASHGNPYNNDAVQAAVEQSNGSLYLYNLPAEAYLRYDLKPLSPYANLQDWQGKYSPDLQSRILTDYGSAKAEYVLVAKTNDMKQPIIQPVLDSKYRLVQTFDHTPDGPLQLYQRR